MTTTTNGEGGGVVSGGWPHDNDDNDDNDNGRINLYGRETKSKVKLGSS
jgi:hypothetical protein